MENDEMSARRSKVDETTMHSPDGTPVTIRLYAGGAGHMVRVIAQRRLSVVGLWPSKPGTDSLVEISLHTASDEVPEPGAG
jgi:hypothetical protein